MGNRLFRSRATTALTSTIDVKLTEIDQLIDNTIEQRKNYRLQYNNINRLIVIWGFIINIFILLSTYILHNPHSDINNKIKHILPLGCSLSLLFIVKRIVSLYYNHKLHKCDNYITQLEQRRDEFVEQLMVATDYKRIQNVIEQHNKKKQLQQSAVKQQPIQQQQNTQQTPRNVNSNARPQQHNNTAMQTPANSSSKLTTLAIPQTPNSSGSNQSIDSTRSLSAPLSAAQQQQIQALATNTQSSQQPLSPQATDWNDTDQRTYERIDILSAQSVIHRSITDKLIDFILGEGPNNRYALICEQCMTHNGLVREENSNIKFKCIVCNHINNRYKQSPSKQLINTTNKLQQALNNVQQQQQQQNLATLQQPLQTHTTNQLVNSNNTNNKQDVSNSSIQPDTDTNSKQSHIQSNNQSNNDNVFATPQPIKHTKPQQSQQSQQQSNNNITTSTDTSYVDESLLADTDNSNNTTNTNTSTDDNNENDRKSNISGNKNKSGDKVVNRRKSRKH